jgi:hypothetical protein
MEYVYVMINGSDWEDMVIYINKKEALEASIMDPNHRIEIFAKNPDFNGYTPTYNYFLAGKLYIYSNE